MRKIARETAFKLIFEYLFIREFNETSLTLLSATEGLDDNDREYLTKTYNGLIENFDTIYNEIASLSSDFKAERIFKADMAILLLAIYEIKYADDVPDKVAVNEAVELSKTYSTDKSHSFINGILASYIAKR